MSLFDDLVSINNSLSATLQGINSLLPFEAETLKDAPPIIEVAIGSARQEGEESGYGTGYDDGYGAAESFIVHQSNEAIMKYTTPAEDWSELPSKIDEVHGVGVHDGKLSLLESSKYMRGNAEGEVVPLRDVSPIEHEVSVSVDDEAAVIRVIGKNWYNSSFSVGGIVGASGNEYGNEARARSGFIEVKQNQFYIFSCEDYVVTNKHAYDKDKNWIAPMGNAVTGKLQTLKTPDGTCFVRIVVKKADETSFSSEDIEALNGSNAQLELGTNETDYEPYKGAEYEQGEPIASISPNMTITTDKDGATVSVEYLRDIDLYIDSLITGVALSGGE